MNEFGRIASHTRSYSKKLGIGVFCLGVSTSPTDNYRLFVGLERFVRGD